MADERTANSVDVRLGQRVRMRRLEIGMSQEKLAEITGVTFQQIQKYEKGVNRIAASRLFAIAAALDVPIGRFFEGLKGGRDAQDGVRQDAFLDDVLGTPEGVQLVGLFGSITSTKVRRRVVELVRALAVEEATQHAPHAQKRQRAQG